MNYPLAIYGCLLGGAGLLFGTPGHKQSPPTTIRVDASKVLNRITPWMYGSCIEDVNHEIYGGLYAQRIFGESFEEPPTGSPLEGWKSFGGVWSVKDGALHVEQNAGAKLVRDSPLFENGAVECDVRLNDSNGSNAGLILRVDDPHTGADNWIGYEISISAHDKNIHFSQHHNNWRPLSTVPAPVDAGRWHRLRVEMTGNRTQVFLDGKGPYVDVTDGQDAVLSGKVGLRTWQSNASYRNLTIEAGKSKVADTLSEVTPATKSVVSEMWRSFHTGSASAEFHWLTGDAYNGEHAQTITHGEGAGRAGIINRGLNRWGIPFVSGQEYTGRLYVRTSGYKGPLTVGFLSADGSITCASQSLTVPTGSGWNRLDFRLKPKRSDGAGEFFISIDQQGTVDIDQVYLSGTGKELFKGLPYRSDISNLLVKQGLTFMRYGGTMVNATGYRWKKMIGDRDKRPPYTGWWYPYSTNGFGIEDFVRFCEAAKITPAFAINIEETPEDAADLVEYLNGPVTSVWGKKRAENGHPKPYGVKYIEIGNEEALDGSQDWYRRYLERFKLLYPAMHAKDPNLRLVIAAWWKPSEPLVEQIAKELADKAALWDVHVGGDDLNEGANVDKVFTEMKALFAKWIPGSPLKACVFEENGGRHDFQRALGHAYILNVTQRHGDFVMMDCPANCLQPMGQNDNGWDQGQVFFTPDKAWGMPPYYSQQMAAINHLPLRVAGELSGESAGLDVTVTRSENGKALVLKVVNTGIVPRQTGIQLDGFANAKPNVDVWTLTGGLKQVNTPQQPESVKPVKSTTRIDGEHLTYTFPALSYTVLRLSR